MRKHIRNNLYILSIICILFIGYSIRILPLRDNNFYFTIDQGSDALNAREIIYRHQLPLLGPETNITGVFAGPLWSYFLSIGYLFSHGHPVGGITILIVLNLLLTLFLIFVFAKKVSVKLGITVGVVLQFFWWFYETSRYSFNPFPNLFITVAVIISLSYFFEKKKTIFLFIGAVFVGLSFHFEIAFAMALLLFYMCITTYCLIKKNIRLSDVLICITLIVFLQFPQIISELQTDFSMFHTFLTNSSSSSSVFNKTSFTQMTRIFVRIIGETILPEHTRIGTLLYGALGYIYFKIRHKKEKKFANHFVRISLTLTLLCWVWFGVTNSWRAWHTIALPSILYISLLLMIWSFPRKLRYTLLVFLMIFQTSFFISRYKNSLDKDDPAVLKNQLHALDWVYKEASGNGFYIYTYEPSVYDTTSQYLLWWYGREKYGYVPCEYSSYPDSPDLFVPGKEYYLQPQRPCSNTRFLMMFPDKNNTINPQWYSGITKQTNLEKEILIGGIRMQKRSMTNDTQNNSSLHLEN